MKLRDLEDACGFELSVYESLDDDTLYRHVGTQIPELDAGDKIPEQIASQGPTHYLCVGGKTDFYYISIVEEVLQ